MQPETPQRTLPAGIRRIPSITMVSAALSLRATAASGQPCEYRRGLQRLSVAYIQISK